MNKLIDDLISQNVIRHSGGMIYECTDGAQFFTDYEADAHCDTNGLDKDQLTEEYDDNYYILNQHINKLGWGFNGTLYTSSEIIEMHSSNPEKLFDTKRIKTCKEVADEIYESKHAVKERIAFENEYIAKPLPSPEEEPEDNSERFWFKD